MNAITQKAHVYSQKFLVDLQKWNERFSNRFVFYRDSYAFLVNFFLGKVRIRLIRLLYEEIVPVDAENCMILDVQCI